MRKLKPWAELNDLPKIQQVGFYCVPTFWLGFRPTLVQLPFLPSSLFGILPCNFGSWFSPYAVVLFPSVSPMGLRGFSVVPKVKGGLFFFQKVLYKLVVGSGNEDSHGNNIKIMLQSLSLQDSPFEARGSLPAQLVWSWEWAALWISVGVEGRASPSGHLQQGQMGEDGSNVGNAWGLISGKPWAPGLSFPSLMWPPGTQPGHASSSTSTPTHPWEFFSKSGSLGAPTSVLSSDHFCW